AEQDLYPLDLLDRQDWTEHGERQWWALYTLSRREKELMRRLRALEISHYGPTIEKRGRSPQGRIRTSFIPLFTNYVFLYGDASQRYAALATNCVSRDLPVFDGSQLAFDLRRLRQMLVSGVPVMPESKLEPGARVRVCSGPLTGHEGTVLRRRGETRLLVAVRFLQQGASVQIDEHDLEPL
ncbi:MAG: transcription termination/antitermination protein NusG, partial [Deltaproteobacteria bacterium]